MDPRGFMESVMNISRERGGRLVSAQKEWQIVNPKEGTPLRILVAEDDQSVAEMLELFLRKEGYEPVFVQNGLSALERWGREPYDLLILDWMLPGMDGVRVCQKIRAQSDIPILMLTARTGESDQVLGLEIGADDYVTKPFSPLALMARIKALLRRAGRRRESAAHAEECSRVVSIDETTREVTLCGEKITNLTPKEFDLISLFARYPRRVFSRDELLERIWGMDYYGDERTVDAHIKRLRKKIAVGGKQWIETVWGVGYRWAGDEEHESV